MAFNVGDTVVYPAQGAGKIEELTKRTILGKEQEYLKLTFIRGDMDVLVPLDKCEEVGLRHTIVVEQLEQVFTTLVKTDLDLPNQWPPRHRMEIDILGRAETFELASLIGALSKRDVERGLADTERDIMEKAKDMLASEVAIVQGMSSLTSAKKDINDRLKAILD